MESLFVFVASAGVVVVFKFDTSMGDEDEVEEEGERAKAVVTAKLPPAENPDKKTCLTSIPNSLAWLMMYRVESIQSLTGVGWGYSGERRYSMEMNIAPRPLSFPASVVVLIELLVLLASVVYPVVLGPLVRVHQWAQRESSVALPIVNPPPWKFITQGLNSERELGIDWDREEVVEGEEEGS